MVVEIYTGISYDVVFLSSGINDISASPAFSIKEVDCGSISKSNPVEGLHNA